MCKRCWKSSAGGRKARNGSLESALSSRGPRDANRCGGRVARLPASVAAPARAVRTPKPHGTSVRPRAREGRGRWRSRPRPRAKPRSFGGRTGVGGFGWGVRRVDGWRQREQGERGSLPAASRAHLLRRPRKSEGCVDFSSRRALEGGRPPLRN